MASGGLGESGRGVGGQDLIVARYGNGDRNELFLPGWRRNWASVQCHATARSAAANG